MTYTAHDKDLFPHVLLPTLYGRGLDAIKIVAALLMAGDHVDAVLLGRGENWLFILGRIVFPLFAYAAACAILRKAHLKKYAIVLLIVAVLSQPVFFMATGSYALNAVFTLLLGAIFAYYTAALPGAVLGLCFAAGAALMYFPQTNEYGAAGILLPAALMMVMQGRNSGIPWALLLLALINLSGFRDIIHAPGNDNLDSLLDMIFVMGPALINCAAVPFILIRLAGLMPQNGRLLPKYALHVFYPLHLFVIWAVK